MRKLRFLASAILISAAILAVGSWIHAQTTGLMPVPTNAPTGPPPRLPNGKPDLSGVWQKPYSPDMTRNGRGQQGYAEAPFTPADTPAQRDALRKAGNYAELPFTPAGLDDWKTYDPANGDYTGNCLPFGLNRSINSPEPMQIMQNDKYLALLFEQNTWYHVIYIDGREHPKNLEPTWFGHSIGKWDGDTLVVDTVGFNGWTRLDTVGHPHSDGLHLIQTFRRTDAGHIAYTVTVDDRKAYTKPWKNERTLTLMTTAELIEYSCEENNKAVREGHIKAWTPPESSKYKGESGK
jgi:hypothetical protein